jgi:hypothetical protein
MPPLHINRDGYMAFLKKIFVKAQNSTDDNSVETTKKRQAAAIGVLGLFQEHLPTTFENHPGTSLSAAAWLAGTSLYRSFGYQHNIAPGTVILSDIANEKGPILTGTFIYFLNKEGIKLEQSEVILKFTEEQKPRKNILEIQEKCQDSYNEIMRKNGFDYLEAAKVGAIVCAMMVNYHCIRRHDLEPKLAVGLVLMGFVEGTKTCPSPLKSGN